MSAPTDTVTPGDNLGVADEIEHFGLTPADFAGFYEAVHGHPPFAWQVDLLQQVDTERTWPGLIDLPTGAGKTSALDVAVFALALDAQRPIAQRWAPRRIVMVVDRRIVVDQAHQRATKLVSALDGTSPDTPPTLQSVARALGSLSHIPNQALPDAPPLIAGLLRGGAVRDHAWALRPDVPALLSSTVDQVGSRLLFRGYGIAQRSLPIHAGLMGNDVLYLLDEVHLSQPFAQTLNVVDQLDSVRSPLPSRSQVVQLSATPGSMLGTRFPSTPLRAETSQEPLASRLRARKPTRLEPIKVAANQRKADAQFAKAVAQEANAAIARDHCRVLGVVVNRVDTARRVADELKADRRRRSDDVEVVLLTGRMRPIDRDAILAERGTHWVERHARHLGPRQVVVATQCIEAGADFDFDGLVTECASIDALRQRFGRVDRRGVLSSQASYAQSVVMLRGERAPTDDPVYGSALAETWAWLCGLDPVDFGLERLPEPPEPCVAGKPDAPLLSPLHLRSFAQTWPIPTPDHVVARWLHGDQPTSPAVSVIWRDELMDLLPAATGDAPATLDVQAIEAQLTGRIGFCPPAGIEGVEVPLHAARSWLAGEPPEPISDAEGSLDVSEDIARNAHHELPRFVVWRNRAAELIEPRFLRPGDTVVVASDAGGLGGPRNWDPNATDRVDDLSAEAALATRGRSIIKLGPWLTNESDSTWEGRLYGALRAAIAERSDDTPADVALSVAAEWLVDDPSPARIRSWMRSTRAVVTGNSEAEVAEWHGFIGISSTAKAQQVGAASSSGDADDDASFVGAPAPAYLDEHLVAVGELAAGFASNVGLPEQLINDLRLAGELHDLGKYDPRFQRWLTDGLPNPGPPLAKSAWPAWQANRVRAARELAGYPAGGRHELLSLRLALSGDLLAQASDPDLVAHLVAGHHGFARPFAPAVVDEHPESVTTQIGGTSLQASSETGLPAAGSGLAARFARLLDSYGEVGLAWLEAMFRLADHRRSQLEAERRKDDR
ncbi:MAG: type I-U CRISPR-associated helicase/endonuclease Cas3 [Microthrixaceae bacterium]